MSDIHSDGDNTEVLVERARGGDRAAFEQLFARHQGYLRRLVELRLDSRLRSRVDHDDIVQEAYLEALNRLDDYLERPTLPFRLWLRQIACDRALKAWRRHFGAARRTINREVSLPEGSSLLLANQLLATGSSPSQRLDHQDLVRRMLEAMERLGESDREIVLLRHFEGLSNHEVACLFGIDPGAASKRHGRALLRLHRLLFEDGLTESQL